MKQSMRLGSVAGITIGAHWPVPVVLVLIADVLAVTVLPAAPGLSYAASPPRAAVAVDHRH
jgi:hypothetical protein